MTTDTCVTVQKESATEECCDMPEKMLALADAACEELLKEKIKTAIEKSCGAEMDKMAEFLAEKNCQRWAHTIKGKALCEEFKKGLFEMFVAGACEK